MPFDSWLRDSASLDADGAFDDPLGDRGQRLLRSLAFGAHAALGASVGLAAAAPGERDHRPAAREPAGHVRDAGAGHWRSSATAPSSGRCTRRSPTPAPRPSSSTTRRPGTGRARPAPGARGRADLRLLERRAPRSHADQSGGRGQPGPGHRDVPRERRRAGAARRQPDDAVRGHVTGLPGSRRRQPAGPPRRGQVARAGRGLRGRHDAPRRRAAGLRRPRDGAGLSAAREAGLLAACASGCATADPAATQFAVWNPLLPAAVQLADAYLRNLTLRSFDERVRIGRGAGGRSNRCARCRRCTA